MTYLWEDIAERSMFQVDMPYPTVQSTIMSVIWLVVLIVYTVRKLYLNFDVSNSLVL